jgi:hypothetical protein
VKIHFLYRSAPGDGKPDKRPDFFNKKNCLISFLNSLETLNDSEIGEVIFINDGDLNPEIMSLMNSVKAGIINLNGIGNSESLKFCYKLIEDKKWENSDLIYFAEDDYLYRKEALRFLANAMIDLEKADYFTLYDHPDRYTRTDDADWGLSKILISRDCHWRTVESTPQTFGVRCSVLKKDLWIHKLGLIGKVPRGREMFRASRGLGKYFFKFPKHTLVSPMPSLCTHMESLFMSRLIDWESISDQLKSD